MSLLTPRQSPLEDDGAQYYGYDGSNCYEEHTCGWWWSPTGSAVRYTIVSILFFLLFAYFVGGYWHARRRLRKNLAPLPYHRWMVRTSSPRYHYNAAYNHNYPHGAPMYHQNPYYGQQQHPDSYGMQNSNFAPPPPAYQAGDAPPPVYQPPQGSSKVAADQNYQQGARNGGESSSEVRAPDAAAAAAARSI